MGDFIKITSEIVNIIHDILEDLFNKLGIQLTDKDLHFWIFGVLGIIFFLITHLLFKWLSTLSMTAISFLYSFTVLIVVVFAIEIQQKITGRGNMEFADAIMGLWGFLVFFLGFLFLKLSSKLFIHFTQNKSSSSKRYRSSK